MKVNLADDSFPTSLPARLRILALRSDQLLKASEIAKKLSIPLTTTVQLEVVEDINLIVS